MNIIDKCKIFYKLAIENNEEELKNYYNKDLSKIQNSPTQQNILDFITAYHSSSVFKIDDIIKLIDKLNIHDPTDILDFYSDLTGYSSRSLADELGKHMLDNFIARGQIQDLSGLRDIMIVYSAIMKKININGYLEKIAKKLVLHFIRLERNDHDELVREIKDLWMNLSNEYYHNILSRTFLRELAKRFGVDVYLNTTSDYDWPDIYNEFLKIYDKDVLNIYDVAAMIKHIDGHEAGYVGQNGFFSIQEFKTILNKADEQAKEYLRGFLYTYGMGGQNWLFMLDEAMQPMDRHYKSISWPDNIKPVHLMIYVQGKIQKEWSEIFAEFKIIPR